MHTMRDPLIEAPAIAAPAISVVIPAYNEQQFLGNAIESICRQTFEDFELVVVNNGSTDGTGQIIAEWSARDPRVRGLTLETASLHRSLREGVAFSRGAFIARLDADDVAASDRLQRQYEAMVRNPALGLLGTAAQVIGPNGKSLGLIEHRTTDEEIKRGLTHGGCPFVHSSVMMRRDVYLQAGGYRSGLNLAEDYDLWLRMAAITEMANLPEPLVNYRLHGDSLTVRRRTGLVLSGLCAAAAVVARQSGRPEPFSNGIPVLSKALPLLGLKRRDVRLLIYRYAFERMYLMFPVPHRLKHACRRAAVACGLKPLFHLLMKGLARTDKVRARPRGARQAL